MQLPADLWAAWKALADSRGMTATAFQVLVMKQVLQGEAGSVGLPERSASAKKQGLSIRLRVDEIAAVREAAKAEGHSLSGWIAMLIRARLKQAPSFTAQELEGLMKASTQLMAVGRNINTAIRKLHAEGMWTPVNQPMAAVLTAVRSIEARVNALQAAAERRSNF